MLPSGTCTAMEQNKNAKAAGAAGIVNMAPDPTSNYIWILQGTARDSVSGSAGDNRNRGASVVVDPSAVGLELIPHVAVSGVSGTRLYGRLLEAPGTVYITSQNEVEPESGIMVMDLVRASACLHLDTALFGSEILFLPPRRQTASRNCSCSTARPLSRSPDCPTRHSFSVSRSLSHACCLVCSLHRTEICTTADVVPWKAITIVCITVAVLVLMYAYRVGRSICINEERWEEESFATTQPGL